MAGSELHIFGVTKNIKDVFKTVRDQNPRAKISRQNDEVHVYLDQPISNDEAQCVIRSLGAGWAQCTGCIKCNGQGGPQNSRKYILYPPLILLPTGTPISGATEAASHLLSQFPNCTHVAINSPIKTDDRVRSPQIIPIVGDFGEFDESNEPKECSLDRTFWASCVQNGIFQTWAPMYTMFSRGNITEKKRVLTTFSSQSKIEGSTVVDLYVGIGYFTFSYAKQRPKKIYCWELNRWSIEGLVRAARKNKFNARVINQGERYIPSPNDQIVIFAEDNKFALDRLHEIDLSNLSHINMGLLPDARKAVPIALKMCATATSGDPKIIHLHENIRPGDLIEWKKKFSMEIGDCIHVETIKRYSPGVLHVCGDFKYQER